MFELPLSFKKTYWKTASCIKSSLRTGNGTQHAKHQMNDAIKNQVYPMK